MSGQQIGTVVGGAIGAYLGAGNPAAIQLGMAIGGMIGGAIDPTKIYGPKIGDGQQQTATDGVPIPWVQGTALIAGTIVQVSKRRQIRHKDDGKGSGTEQVTFTAEQDFAILICESCELRDSTMGSVLMVLQDGQIVYDVRDGNNYGDQGIAFNGQYAHDVTLAVLGMSDSWKMHCDFLFGAEDQMPHPTLEAITGVGNTPAYRGSLVAVFKNFDVTKAGDRIPNFQFVVAVKDPGLTINETTYGWKYLNFLKSEDPGDCSAPDYDDSRWLIGPLPLATAGAADNTGIVPFTGTLLPDDTGASRGNWIRRTFSAKPGVAGVLSYRGDDDNTIYWNGVNIYHDKEYAPGLIPLTIPASSVKEVNTVAIRVINEFTVNTIASLKFEQSGTAAADPTLQQVVQRICVRGGLELDDIEASDLADRTVIGYPIARQANAADCLLPLLQAYFGYASEYDAKLRFKYYGGNAEITVNVDDLIDNADSEDGNISSNLRNQATEFPRRIVGSYMDPAQNYGTVTVAAERRSVDVTAIGDQQLQIPVVMSADDAANAVNKALKVTYATLEGTVEYSAPFADSDVYISLAAGEPVIFSGKRYVVDEMVLGNGSLKLTTRYDRQSAYTSNVQAIVGNLPTAPSSPYSGPTALVVMNLPAQRPQDSLGVYIAAASADGRGSWKGCTVQVSYDNMQSWVNAITITMESEIGTVAADEPTSGEPITVNMLKYALSSASASQIAAGANAFAVVDGTGNVTQLGQFEIATETATDQQFDLTGVVRSLGGTAEQPVDEGNPFTMMDAAYFLPIPDQFTGSVLYFRGVGFGEVAESARIYPLTYLALVRQSTSQQITEDGAYAFVTEDGLKTLVSE